MIKNNCFKAWRLLVIVLLATMAWSTALAQSTYTVTGKVTDVNGEPLMGVTVQAQTKQGTATDMDGFYSIKLTQPTRLTFSYIGYDSRTLDVRGSGTHNIVLTENAQVLDDIVVVGYGKQKKINLTGAVSAIDGAEQLSSRPSADLARGLQGAAPGLTVRSLTGEMGQDATIKIRGIYGSMNGSSQPLILVDNVECNSLQNINPEDVESVSVLKDAA